MGRARRVASRRRDRSIDRSIEGRDATASDASDRARVGANDDGDGDDERERCRAVVAMHRHARAPWRQLRLAQVEWAGADSGSEGMAIVGPHG